MRPQLASIENEEENIFIDALLGGAANVWVGAKRLQDGTWIWLDFFYLYHRTYKLNK